MMYVYGKYDKILRNKFITELSIGIRDGAKIQIKNRYIYIFLYLLFAIRMTFPESSCPLLQNNGFSKRQRT